MILYLSHPVTIDMFIFFSDGCRFIPPVWLADQLAADCVVKESFFHFRNDASLSGSVGLDSSPCFRVCCCFVCLLVFVSGVFLSSLNFVAVGRFSFV
uniref:Uncharacterized protein n=1 Tax=Nelumbo nucifera TaxID=4432 RepID=A0A822ZAC2_NELNU|nr:TPA_asm: hypothetical protein HUJ06_014718 [Nelumbo nucifera]